jgi:hypothetical protein
MGTYYAYGLTFRTDQPLPQLPEIDRPVDFDVEFVTDDPFADADWTLPPTLSDVREKLPHRPILSAAPPGLLRISFPDRSHCTIAADRSRIWVYRPLYLSFEYMVSYLTNIVLGLYLRLSEQITLHASGVIIDDRAVLFCGESGAGKSTTAALFATRGHTVVTDDIAPLCLRAGQFWIQPGYPHLRLWEESARALVTADPLPQIAPDWHKQYLNVAHDGYHFAPTAVPLGAIYILEDRAAMPRIESFPPSAALWNGLRHIYLNYFSNTRLRVLEFQQLSQLVATLPVRRIVAPDALSDLDSLYTLIIDDFRHQQTG